MDIKVFVISMTILTFLTVIELVRREKITLKYGLFWLVSSFLALFLAIFDSVLTLIGHWFGFQLVSNFVYFAAMIFLLILCVIMTLLINQLSIRTKILAQKIGLLELAIVKINHPQYFNETKLSNHSSEALDRSNSSITTSNQKR